MSIFKIEGGHPLHGEVQISGNKNAILPIIACCLMTEQEVILENVPDIVDVNHMLDVVRELGGRVEFDKAANRLLIEAKSIKTHQINRELCNKVRTSILFVAPLLHRTDKAELYPPGGDVIGRRRLDTHFYGLKKLGALEEERAGMFCFEKKGAFQGANLFFDQASVTATEHIMMAAAVAEGKTTIRNAAGEPHVQDLAHLLNKMGAKISGIGTNQLEIEGVAHLCGTQHRVVSDHIEAASFLAIAAATEGSITVKGVAKPHYWMAHRVFETLGIDIELRHDEIFLSDNQSRKIVKDLNGAIPTIDDGPWPHFPSDMMSTTLLMATQMEGTVLFFEKMFESRMYFVDRLNAMGANAIICDPHRVVISGKSKLRPATLPSPDIRAGMALLGAALCADGTSNIQNVQMIDRGYERIEHKLLQLGARIKRID